MFLILYMAFMASMSGGSFPGSQWLNKRGAVDEHGKDKDGKLPFNGTWLPEALFAIPFGFIGAISAAKAFGGEPSVWVGLAFWAWSYCWMQTGHGTVLQWGANPAAAQGESVQTLTPVVNMIARYLGLEIGGRNYCRLFMGIKGFLIGLPAGGVPLAIMWLIGYEVGYRLRGKVKFDPHAAAELVAGAGAGIAILVALYGT